MKKIINLLLIIICFSACSSNKFDVDISNIEVDLKIKRLDKDIFELPPNNIEKHLPELRKKYGELFKIYNYQIIKTGSSKELEYATQLRGLITHVDWKDVYSKTKKKYPNLDNLKLELTNAFKHYRYYFPNKNIPEIFTYISAFNQNIVTDENILGIGIDKYLGSDCKFYKYAGIDKYMANRMIPQRISSDCMTAIAEMEFPYNDSIDNLACQMIHKGRIRYFLDAMLPNVKDSIKSGYTLNQFAWAVKFEEKIWTYIVEQKHLFSTDFLLIKKYIGEAPFTAYFSKNSAPQAGIFIGWHIVKSYMENNSNISLKKLMQERNYMKILQKSKYKPK